MSDPEPDPHGPVRLPDVQPTPNPTDLTNQVSLQTGATSRWLVPAGVLALVVIVLFGFAFQIQIVIPVIGIVFAAVMWIVMLFVARTKIEPIRRNRRLAWLMGAMAAGALLIAIALYIVESTRSP